MDRNKKDKNIAGIFALLLGGFGVHRFYLEQRGMGIFYLVFCWFPVMWIVGLIDAIAFFSMDQKDFDRKYNKGWLGAETGSPSRRRPGRRERRKNRRANRQQLDKATLLIRSGKEKHLDYDYDEAIEDFQKALRLVPNSVAAHFNLACAYSLVEEADKAFYHLDRAVLYGFDDFERIRTKDDFAHLRVQEDFEAFAKNGYRLPGAFAANKNSTTTTSTQEGDDGSRLLEQIKALGELRERGLLSEREFAAQKRKLLD